MRLARHRRRVGRQQQRIPRLDPCLAPLLPGTVEKELGLLWYGPTRSEKERTE
jgi:hypothetical protein